MRDVLRFLRRGKIVALKNVAPTQTVLDYLRGQEKSRGTKEGCNEGDCGACTVALGSLRGGRIVYEPVNACILLMGHLDGKELVTVDDLAQGGDLHPVQKAMVDTHASQCGFCTPGFVMSLFTLYHSGQRLARAGIVDHLAGNLCRCTGYRPIVDAAIASCAGKADDGHGNDAALLSTINDGTDLFIGDALRFLAVPANAATLTALVAAHPTATIVGGATDVGLWITKQLRVLPKIIHVGGVAALHAIAYTDKKLILGAAVTYAEAEKYLGEIDPDIAEVLRRLGSKQVRSVGTIGGNIANGSPIGDMAPLLMALGSRLQLRHAKKTRDVALEDFFVSYGRQDRKSGELVWRIEIPKLRPNEVFRAYKISKRFDQDISAVLGAFKFKLNEARIVSARVCFGGMAATPSRAAGAEAALAGVSIDQPQSWSKAIAALAQDFQPISDMRASAEYRLEVAGSLLRKALMEVAGASDTRIVGEREATW